MSCRVAVYGMTASLGFDATVPNRQSDIVMSEKVFCKTRTRGHGLSTFSRTNEANAVVTKNFSLCLQSSRNDVIATRDGLKP
eukprot:scaffold329556_cov48-Prasinocladus_malaysianus.AAC.2